MDAVLFDLFGVIAHDHSPAGRTRLAGLSGAPDDTFWNAYWGLRRPYDRGDVTGPEYWRTVADALGLEYSDTRITDLIDADLASWSGVDPTMVGLVEDLAAAGRRIALLSNIPEELAARYEERQAWLKDFEVLGFSCRIGHAKPEPEAYLWCCRSLRLAPEQVLFVDDRPENVAGAERLGLRGHLFTTPARLRADLRAHLGSGLAR